ncbi:MAG: hypothetical protein IH592_15690 [Bacteroidales bacterium]|nr:hypothetical protein [Bacteroidales bacterium]
MTNSEEKVLSSPGGGRIAFRMDQMELLIAGGLTSVQLKEIAILNFEYLKKCALAESELFEGTLKVLRDMASKD